MQPTRKMLSTQSRDDKSKYRVEIVERLEAASDAIAAFKRMRPGVAIPEHAVYEATLSGLNFVIEDLRTAALVASAEAPAPTAREDACTCCVPPVLLARHTHRPIQGVFETAAEVAEREERNQDAVQYRDAAGRTRRVRLEEDQLVPVTVRGRTWPLKDTLRRAGLTWNGKHGAESAWLGRIGPEGLLLLGCVHDDHIEVRFPAPGASAKDVPVASASDGGFYG